MFKDIPETRMYFYMFLLGFCLGFIVFLFLPGKPEPEYIYIKSPINPGMYHEDLDA